MRNAPTTIVAGVIDKAFYSAKTGHHPQKGTKRANYDAPEPLLDNIKEENKGENQPYQKTLVKIGLLKGEYRLLQESIERLRPDCDRTDIGKI
jgi:hypothetical protein